ncbi:hypothetical protein [Paenibacillus silvae]|uniref:hypothetical protein n=1 Tax=Paenibacillus silvae TaxID=1325358 RepID=UPI002004E75B|nr:hypothetical protein [Paenibacillus silvae]
MKSGSLAFTSKRRQQKWSEEALAFAFITGFQLMKISSKESGDNSDRKTILLT